MPRLASVVRALRWGAPGKGEGGFTGRLQWYSPKCRIVRTCATIRFEVGQGEPSLVPESDCSTATGESSHRQEAGWCGQRIAKM
jgi:hypothetical protein